MSQSAIRTAVYNAVNGVTDAGKVYDRERFSASWDTFLSQFKTTISGTDQIRGWTVSFAGYASPPEKLFAGPPGAQSFVIARPYVFKVMGYMGLNDADATEKTFATLAEAVVAALDADSTLHDDSTYLETSPASIDLFGTLLLGSVLCNHAEITIIVTEAANI